MKEYKLFINGQWREAVNKNTKEVLSPSTGECIAIVQDGDAHDAEVVLEAAQSSFKHWAKTPARKRAECLREFVACNFGRPTFIFKAVNPS